MYMIVRPAVFKRINEQLALFRQRGIPLNAGFQFQDADYTVRMVVGPGLLDREGDITVRVGPGQQSRIYVGHGATELDVAARMMKLSPGDEIAVLFTRKSDKEEGIPTRACSLQSNAKVACQSVIDGLDYQFLDFADMPGRVFVGGDNWNGAGIWF
jgi:TusA-related sulfurtransferase